MSLSVTFLIWLILSIGLANFPFFSSRFFLVKSNKKSKTPLMVILELFCAFILFLLLGLWLESRQHLVYEQGWEFYAILFCWFLVLAFPGFVWRYLRKRVST